MDTQKWPFTWQELEGERVRLRRHTLGDVEDMVLAGSDADTQRFTTVPSPYQRHHAESFVGRTPQDNAGLYWVVTDAADPTGRYMGQIDLRTKLDGVYLDFGYLAAPWARGRGLMTDAVVVIARFAFGLGAQRLEIRARADNAASRRVAEKAGFTFEGILRHALMERGQLEDCAVYSKLPTD